MGAFLLRKNRTFRRVRPAAMRRDRMATTSGPATWWPRPSNPLRKGANRGSKALAVGPGMEFVRFAR
jgi:hypothetical protein